MTNGANIQHLQSPLLKDNGLTLSVLRLDKVHSIVSGNKWFKLKYYIQDAARLSKVAIATFGGAWSNHIVAAAFVARQAGLASIGIIRGEEPPERSVTLKAAEQYGMTLYFVSRSDYRNKENIVKSFDQQDWYWINEGGYGEKGMQGAAEILAAADTGLFTHIIAAVGTGTMLAGLAISATPNQQIIGINSMKNNPELLQQVAALINGRPAAPYLILNDYHLGGYGKHPTYLVSFINEVYRQHHLPLDIVYTGKTFLAIEDLIKKNYFDRGSKLLMIHSGGLQGNLSLPPEVLAF